MTLNTIKSQISVFVTLGLAISNISPIFYFLFHYDVKFKRLKLFSKSIKVQNSKSHLYVDWNRELL